MDEKTKIFKSAAAQIGAEKVWRLFKKVCQDNQSGRKIYIKDALVEAIENWITMNQVTPHE